MPVPPPLLVPVPPPLDAPVPLDVPVSPPLAVPVPDGGEEGGVTGRVVAGLEPCEVPLGPLVPDEATVGEDDGAGTTAGALTGAATCVRDGLGWAAGAGWEVAPTGAAAGLVPAGAAAAGCAAFRTGAAGAAVSV